MRIVTFAVLSFVATITAPAYGQAQNQESVPTLHVTSRAVLVDVVVTDRKGRNVRDLPRSAFHVADNGRPQKVNAFEEHSGPAPIEQERVSLPKNIHTNTDLRHAPPVETILFIDTTNMAIEDQMVLYPQLLRLLDRLPGGVPLTVFLRALDSTVMLQNLTADHKLLKDAIQKAIPHPQIASGDFDDEETDGLMQVAGYLTQVPGRKNVLWLNGGSSMFTHPGPWSSLSGPVTDHTTDGSVPIDEGQIRILYDLLETARIALYPIDVRGLTAQKTAALLQQHLYEASFAAQTGGKAFFNGNDMTLASEKALQDGDDFYSLSYQPEGLNENGAWHTIRVSVDGNYDVGYRRGYFDDGPHVTGVDHVKQRHLLRTGGQQIEAPSARSRPLIFRTKVAPADAVQSGGHGKQVIDVHFDIPAAELKLADNGSIGSAKVGAAIVVFNETGQQVSHVSQTVDLKFDEALYRSNPLAALSFDQRIEVSRKQESYLHIAVWDAATGRMGTVDVPVQMGSR